MKNDHTAKRPTAFISYSHADKEFVSKLAKDLMQGIEVWVDQFDLRPGDSLIQKIFGEGLAKSDFFLIVLSSASTSSEWVKEELNAAIIRKIEGVTRIIPIIKEPSEIPLPLRSLLYIDLSKDYDEGIRTLLK
ncbi:MAG TPA: toll/interleukin-1 receptor domain-containing protein [Pyrinomonadaceae bacterium]